MSIDLNVFVNDARCQPVIITFWVGLATSIVTVITGCFKLKIEHERIEHEKSQWILDFLLDKEQKLQEARIRSYPNVMRWLKNLSNYNENELDSSKLHRLIGELNSLGYSEAALFMLPETRSKLFALREELRALVSNEHNFLENLEKMRSGNRTQLTEMLRRDLSHHSSDWGEYSTLLEDLIKQFKSIKKNRKRDWFNCFSSNLLTKFRTDQD
ncbi:hypothetical protein VZG28_10310 [Synechococcus elongatus IITB4]|uniref:hypothetical protein n=1 Tax=Synechococcus elongatus TaxID=32046 RepID=UPI0030CB815B